jgi:hypothetical protein
MGNTQASSVVTLAPVLAPAIPELEQPREFHFAVTWVTLFAHLDLIPSNGPWRGPQAPSPTLALVPVAAAPVIIQPPAFHDSSAGWEMVVPKMIRTDDGDFAPAEKAGS